MLLSTPAHHDRANGLDTLRAAAITLVFMYHYQVFVSGEATFGWASVIGWVGVDLFFVLSGYLIADSIFAGFVQGKQLSLAAFYLRRALRTLPLFWLILALYFLFPALMGGRTPPPLWRFLSFTQNFGLQPGTAFSHAWSLCIEEQFYLVLPLVIVASTRSVGPRWRGWALLAGLMLIGITTRALLWRTYGRQSDGQVDGYMAHIYYASPCRFDEFLPGIAVAMLKNFHRPLWGRIKHHGRLVFAAGTIATAAMFTLAYFAYDIAGYGFGFFMTAFGYSLIAISFALLVVAALSPGHVLHDWRFPGAYRLALWSYAIYLSHKPLAVIVQRLLAPWHLPNLLQIATITLACLVIGAMLHRWVEAPFMALRRRYVPTNFPRARSASASKTLTGA